MSREILTGLMESVKTSPKADFAEIIQDCMDYGFIDDLELAKLFGLDTVDLEEIMDDPEVMDKKTWNSYANKLYRFLVKENNKYNVIYFKHS